MWLGGIYPAPEWKWYQILIYLSIHTASEWSTFFTQPERHYTYIYSEQDGCLRLFNHFQKIICWWRRNWCNLSDQKSRQDNNKIKNPLSFSNNWQQQTQNWYRNNNEKQKKFSKFSFWSIFLTLYCLHICLSGIRCVFMPIGIGFRSGISQVLERESGTFVFYLRISGHTHEECPFSYNSESAAAISLVSVNLPFFEN